MVRKGKRGKIGGKVFAAIMSVTLGLSNLAMSMPGEVAYAETEETSQEPDSAAGAESSAEGDSSEGSVEESENDGDDSVKSEGDNNGSAQSENDGDSSKNSATGDKDSQQTDSASADSGEEGEAKKVSSSESSTGASTGSSGEKSADDKETKSTGASSEAGSAEKSGESAKASSEGSTVLITDDEFESGEDEMRTYSDRSFEYSKTDIWDFGAENFGDSYNNRIDAYTVNGFYSDKEPGTEGTTIGSFVVDDGDFSFEDGGAAHRLRSTNTELTRYDTRSLKDENGNAYSGYLYSNSGSNTSVYVAVECQADDIITAYVASNGGTSTIHFQNVSDESDDTSMVHTLGSSTVSKMVFYPADSSKYKIYSTDEKLVVARVLREHASYGTLTGSVEGFTGTGSFDIVFTNESNGNEVTATVSDGTFYATLAQGFDYAMSLKGADGYVITSDKKVNISGDESIDVTVASVDLVDVKGMVKGIEKEDLEAFVKAAKFVFTPADPDSVYVPKFELSEDGSFESTFQKSVEYAVKVEGVDDYTLLNDKLTFDKEVEKYEIEFIKKDLTKIEVKTEGIESSELDDATFSFTLLDKDDEFAKTDYVYSFPGKEISEGKAALREGQYAVTVTDIPTGYAQYYTKDAKVDDEHVKDDVLTVTVPFKSTVKEKVPYSEVVTVGNGKDYETIGDAIEAIRNMDRTSDQRVTVEIQPGDYQEMLVIDTPNVSLKNANAGGSIKTVDKGVGISSDSVRITGYYGHGYTYYSIGKDCKYNSDLLEVNKYNGYPSFVNPGTGTTAGSYWNATVVVNAEGFEARDIIFENSFNQYQSELAANDVIVKLGEAKENAKAARADMAAGDVTVQEKDYVERAAAMALTATATKAYFNHCAFIGRQDTLYGAVGSTEAYYNCDIYGGTDYIFGGMTAVFAKCNLVFNTSDSEKDYGYVTAAQQKSAGTRGYLMYNCKITSTEPGVNTASENEAVPGYFGRPWQSDTSEVVYFDTVIDATCSAHAGVSKSLVKPEGWGSMSGSKSARNVEYGTVEMSGVDNSSSRVSWANTKSSADEAITTDGQPISVATFLGSWDPFDANGDDMTIVLPDGTEIAAPESGNSSATSEFVFESKDLETFAAGAKKDGDEEQVGTEKYFTLIYSAKSKVDTSTKNWSDEYTSGVRLNLGGVASTSKNAIKFKTSNSATVKVWWAQGGDDNRQVAILDGNGETVAITEGTYKKNDPYISTLKLEEAGTYYLGGATNNNYFFKIVVTEDVAAEPVVSTLESKDLETFAAGAKKDGDEEKVGTDKFFTLVYSAKSKVDTSTKTWADEYTSGIRLNLGGVVSTAKNAIKFTTSAPNATVKVWWAQGGDDNRQVAILDSEGNTAAITEGTYKKNDPYISTLTLEKPGTYYLGGSPNNNYFFKVEVTDGAPTEVVRKDWKDVKAPEVKKIALNAKDEGNIDVTVGAVVGKDGGEELTVKMYDADDSLVESKKSTAEKDEATLTFAPTKSGDYYFVAELSREEEENKVSDPSDKFSFKYPLTAPQFKNATNKGAGKVVVKFYSVSEAESYTLYAADKANEKDVVKTTVTPKEVVYNTSTEYSHTFVGLKVGHTYVLALTASRGDDVSKEETMEVEVKADGETEWVFSAFGSGVSKGSNIGSTVNDDGSVTVWNTGNKGKIVPASTDGLSFYYTAIPANKNFTLTATATIDSWTFTNGQEGFGLMAADRVGVNGDAAAFWNNSYMASGTKVEYYYDNAKNEVTTDPNASKITMKLGLGSQQKVGVTAENLERLEANDTETINNDFSSTMYPLETSCGAKGSGTYNIFAKEAGGTIAGTTVDNPLTTVRLRIQKNNTGYFVSYLDENDKVISTKKYYDTKALEQVDSGNVYVGFFAARTFKATFSDIDLVTIDPADDAPAEDKPITYVVPDYKIISATYSNTEEYELQYTGNADGTLTITDAKGTVLVNAQEVKENAVIKVKTKLSKGDNKFAVKFIPSEFFCPGGDEYVKLESYEAKEFTHTVKYAIINNDEKVYVSPDGKADADGTENDAVDIYTAVKYVQPGQTIVLQAGTYSLKSTVKVDRGIDGTADEPIRMDTDGGRAIFDFNSRCAGFILAGNYWYIKGIDCTKSGNSQKGIQVSGSHITLEDVRTYENGNTGIQVSRYLSTDERSEWPSYDLILNCTSYGNADAGYEDADGFAAKLTCGEGIVFDGCIAYNNADDGWDLFAKVETGSIGQVTIQNCVAFGNGYGVDGTNEGNGNGFKMGGSSMSGNHKLINSVAWDNKAKGIDSNSGPNIQVFNSMSFNNGSNNVALYTNDTANTDFLVDGVISFRTDNKGTNENLKLKGTQDKSKVYGSKNFFWDDKKSSNAGGLTVEEDWFESLSAPKASASDPYAVAESLRASNGSIDLGDFLKLSATGKKALTAAGLKAKEIAADLDGSYEQAADDDDDNGGNSGSGSSSENSSSSSESTSGSSGAGSSASTGASESSSAGSSASTGTSSSTGSSASTGTSTGASSSASTGTAGSAGTGSESTSTGTSESAGTGSGVSDSSTTASGSTSSGATSTGSATGNNASAVTSTGATAASAASSASTAAPAARNAGPIVRNTGAAGGNNDANAGGDDNAQGADTDTALTANNDAATADVSAVAETASAGKETSNTPSGSKEGSVQTTIEEQKSATSDRPETPIPVVPIAGGTVVVVAAAAVAVKTGLFAKLLAFFGIIK